MTKRFLLDLAERAGTSAAEAALTFLIGAQALGFDVLEGTLLAAAAAGLTAIRVGLAEWLSERKTPPAYWRDVLVRAAATYAVVFLPAVIAAPADVSSWTVAAVTAIAPALSVVKSFLARLRGNPREASIVDLDEARSEELRAAA